MAYGGFSWGNPQLMTAQAAPQQPKMAQYTQGGAPGWTAGSMGQGGQGSLGQYGQGQMSAQGSPGGSYGASGNLQAHGQGGAGLFGVGLGQYGQGQMSAQGSPGVSYGDMRAYMPPQQRAYRPY